MESLKRFHGLRVLDVGILSDSLLSAPQSVGNNAVTWSFFAYFLDLVPSVFSLTIRGGKGSEGQG